GHWSKSRDTVSALLVSLPATPTHRAEAGDNWHALGLVATPNAALRQLQFLSSLRLVQLENRPSTARRTAAGLTYVALRSDALVVSALANHVFGVAEVLSCFEGGFQGRVGRLLANLQVEFVVTWETEWQLRFRRNWLRGSGA